MLHIFVTIPAGASGKAIYLVGRYSKVCLHLLLSEGAHLTRFLTYLKKNPTRPPIQNPPPPKVFCLGRLHVYLAESFVSSKKDPGGNLGGYCLRSTCLMYMYLSPLVSVVRMYRYTPRSKDQANLWGGSHGMVWYGYWYGIGMHSETDWKWSEK